MQKTNNPLFKQFTQQFQKASFSEQRELLTNRTAMDALREPETVEWFVKILDPEAQHIKYPAGHYSADHLEEIKEYICKALHRFIEKDAALITPALISRIFYYRCKNGDNSTAGRLLEEMTKRRPEFEVYQNENLKLAAAADILRQKNLEKRTLAVYEQSIQQSFRIVADLALRPIAGDQNLYLTFERRAGGNLSITLDLTKMPFPDESRSRKGLNRLKRRLEKISTVKNIILTEQYGDRQNHRKTQPVYYESYIQGTTSVLSNPKLTATLPCTQETLIALKETAKAMLQHEISLTLVAGVRAARKLAREHNGVKLYEKTCRRIASTVARSVKPPEQAP